MPSPLELQTHKSVKRGFPAFRRDTFWAWGMLSPTLAGLLLFLWGPLLYAVALGFYQWDILTPKVFVGADNYIKLFHDPMFYHSLKITCYYVLLFVPATVAVSLVLAVLLNRIRFAVFFRTLFFMPSVSMSVATSLVWLLIYNPQYGLINSVLDLFGWQKPGWIYDPLLVVPSITLMALWSGAGYNAIFYLAALQNIPSDVYEAAEIDGAVSWRKLWYITVPLVSPTTFFLLIVNLIGSFQAFDTFYVMTKGGPGDSSTTLLYYIYENAFRSYNIGYASSLSTVLFVIIILITIFQFQLQKKWVFYER